MGDRHEKKETRRGRENKKGKGLKKMIKERKKKNREFDVKER